MRILALLAGGLLVLAAAGIGAAEEGGILPIEPVPEVASVATVLQVPFDSEEGWHDEGTITRLDGDGFVLEDLLLVPAAGVVFYHQSGSTAGRGDFTSGTRVRYRVDAQGDVTAMMKVK